MPASLPERPDLGQLRRQAKELCAAARGGDAAAIARIARHLTRAPADTVTLAAAQLVIAREHGFASWPKLKAAVDGAGDLAARAGAFVTACVTGQVSQAARLAADDPRVTGATMAAAAAAGDAAQVRDRLGRDPDAATLIDGQRGWPPLLYASYSHWHWGAPARAAGLSEVARLLLAAGADPRTSNGGRGPAYRSAVRGAVRASNPAVLALLLERGASADDPDALYHAAAHADHRCLALLLAQGADVARSWALDVAAGAGDAEAVRLLLAAAVDTHPVGQVAALASRALTDCVTAAPAQVVEALLAAGADPAYREDPDSLPVLRLAVRAGRDASAAALLRHGAPDDTTAADRLLGALSRADRPAAEQILAQRPELPGELSGDDQAIVVDTAADAGPDAVALMLDFGLPLDARNGFGETPLHASAYAGNAPTVRLLLARGAEVDARDARFDATPLAFATVGSGERGDARGDYRGTVTALLGAGAARHGVWITGKPPSDAVATLLRRYGIGEDQAEPAPQPPPSPAPDEPGGTPADGPLSEIAAQLTAAFESLDTELLASLLDPAVRWTGECRGADQVVRWYEGILSDGTRPTIQEVETRGDAVIVRVALSRPAVAAAPAPPAVVYQVFHVADAAIVEIKGFQDREAALAAARRR
ncbi:MAG TPA: ankyrin repeat domain-containing protein [Streptosporangiaceae bacterium]